MVRSSSNTDNWTIIDTTRGWPTPYPIVNSNSQTLYANSTSAENDNYFGTTATGFVANDTIYGGLNGTGRTYIYIAIRRGPMKVPTSGTSVFSPLTYSGTSSFTSGTDLNTGVATRTISDTLNFDVDMSMTYWRSGGSTPDPSASLMDKLRGYYQELRTYSTGAGSQSSNTGPRFSTRFSRGFALHDYGAEQLNVSGQSLISYAFSRAPSFFDVVCYTGTGANRTVAHNLTVVPELMIVKRRSATEDWGVYSAPVGNTSRVDLNTTGALTTSINSWNDTSPTASVFTVGISVTVNGSGSTYVAYLFATCPGVSKVGGYTGTGTTLQIDCGFTAGARFVLIKRTDSTGGWYVWDSARGIVAGDDPYLLLNSTAAEVTNTDYVDTYSAGFEISSTAPAAINASGGTFIFLAIA
jgi:hypothetical protein